MGVTSPRGEHLNEAFFLFDAEPDPIRTLVSQLADLLAELSTDHSQTTPADHNQWRRLSTPDIEIHVRQPNGTEARERLADLAESVQQLLNREA